ncbi:MAG: medium chain dehydrogenase/reductase family protein [Candidatus Binatia bacterium]|nr:medium chain dehydrogenase/reductase family protein [Candidatus Binatia bacterium]
MRQIWIPKAGAPEVLEVREAPDPSPAPGEVRIRVAATGINFADIAARLGTYQDCPPMPVVVGYEVAGTVDAVGSGVDGSFEGREVLALTHFGGYCDVVCTPVAQVFDRPDGMDAKTGAAIPVNYITAWQLVVAMGGLKAGETVLIHSAGGGVGVAVTQLAKNIGATVIGTASAGKHDFIRGTGVDHCIDYRTEDFAKRVQEITNGKGVELALDAVGGPSFAQSYDSLSPTGRLGMFGVSAGTTGKDPNRLGFLKAVLQMPWLKFHPPALMNANKGVFGVNLGRMWHEVERLRPWMESIVGLWNDGVVKPVISKTFPFSEAAAAHHYIQDRKNQGKVLLEP